MKQEAQWQIAPKIATQMEHPPQIEIFFVREFRFVRFGINYSDFNEVNI